MSSMKRERNAVTIETKFEIINQPAIGVRYNIGIVIRLSEKN